MVEEQEVSPRKKFSRRGISVACGIMALVLATSSVAYACTVKTGQTYWCDNHGTEERNYYNVGSTVCGEARSANPYSYYQLVTGLHGTHADIGHQCMDNVRTITSTVRQASSTGFIGHTNGTLDRAGTWQVCFYEVTSGRAGATATGSVVVSNV